MYHTDLVGLKAKTIHFPTLSEYYSPFEIIKEEAEYIIIGSWHIEKNNIHSVKMDKGSVLIDTTNQIGIIIEICAE